MCRAGHTIMIPNRQLLATHAANSVFANTDHIFFLFYFMFVSKTGFVASEASDTRRKPEGLKACH